jgi:AcrR family transcriptional regulator
MRTLFVHRITCDDRRVPSASSPATAADGPLRRERIVEVALELIDGEGLSALTMRGLAQRLDVRASSLYNHVRSKEQILDAVAATVLEPVDTSGFGRLAWREALHAWAWSYYEALAAHPNVVPYLAVATGRTHAAMARAEQVYRGLREAGWSASRATRIAAAIRYAVYGAALGSFAGSFQGEAAAGYPGLDDVERMREQAPRVDRGALELLIDRFLDGLETIAPTG